MAMPLSAGFPIEEGDDGPHFVFDPAGDWCTDEGSYTIRGWTGFSSSFYNEEHVGRRQGFQPWECENGKNGQIPFCTDIYVVEGAGGSSRNPNYIYIIIREQEPIPFDELDLEVWSRLWARLNEKGLDPNKDGGLDYRDLLSLIRQAQNPVGADLSPSLSDMPEPLVQVMKDLAKGLAAVLPTGKKSITWGGLKR